MLKKIKQWLSATADVAMPRLCPVCRQTLDSDEKWICRKCLSHLPRTRYEEVKFNAMEQRFAGLVPIERATAYFYYEKGSPYASILHDIKYHNAPTMGRWLTARAVDDMAGSHFFDNIDVVTAVPLHRSKLAKRGYNQSEYLARGIAGRLGIPYVEALKAVLPHSTQTHKSAMERWKNIQGNYVLRQEVAQQLSGKHILLVDDVVTTGATLVVGAAQLKTIPGATVSLFTLAAAKLE